VETLSGLSQLVRTYHTDPSLSLQRAREAYASALERNDTETAACAAYISGMCLLYSHRLEEAGHLLEHALILTGITRELHLNALAGLGIKAYLASEWHTAMQIFLDLKQKALSSHNTHELGISFLYIGRIYLDCGEIEKARENIDHAHEASRVADNRMLEARVALADGQCRMILGEYEQALDQTKKSQTLFQEEHSMDAVEAILQTAEIQLHTGSCDGIESMLRDCLRSARITLMPKAQMRALLLLGRMYARKRLLYEAIACHKHSMLLSQAYHLSSGITDNARDLIEHLFATGQLEASFEYGKMVFAQTEARTVHSLRAQMESVQRQHAFEDLSRELAVFKKRTQELEQDKQSIHLLSQAVHEIVSTVNADLAFDVAKKHLHTMVHIDALALVRKNEEDESLSVTHSMVQASVDYATAYHECETHARKVLSERSIVHVRQGSDHGFTFCSAAAFPLYSRGELIGALVVLSEKPFSFSGHEIDVMSTISDFYAISLANHRMVEQMRQQNTELIEKRNSLSEALIQLQAAHDEIEHLAVYDQLTGLPNRYLFTRRMEEIMEITSRNGSFFALFFIDLDNFKQLNDTFGHRVGDSALRLVSKRMQENVRKSDIIARVGGDEFIGVFYTMKRREDIRIIAEKLMTSIERPLKFGNAEVVLRASIGISIYPDHGTDVSQLIEKADQALYKVKSDGRGTFRFYSSSESYEEICAHDILSLS
jgi:diguanylate cyclase (GGDEF)-like protein